MCDTAVNLCDFQNQIVVSSRFLSPQLMSDFTVYLQYVCISRRFNFKCSKYSETVFLPCDASYDRSIFILFIRTIHSTYLL